MKASQAHAAAAFGNELERRELEALIRVLLHQTLDADVRRAEADRLEHREQLRRPCGEEGERRGERGSRGAARGRRSGARRRRTEAVAQRKVGRAVGEALRVGAELEEGDAADAERRRHAEPLRELAAEGDQEQRDEDDLERREEGDDGRRARLQRERLRAVAEREPEPALEAAHHQLARQLPLAAAEQRRERGGGDGEARGGGGARLSPPPITAFTAGKLEPHSSATHSISSGPSNRPASASAASAMSGQSATTTARRRRSR